MAELTSAGILSGNEPQHIVCQSALSACQELITDLTDEERKSVLASILDHLPEDGSLLAASSLFESILAKRDPKLAGYMPKDFIEKAAITAHTLALNNIESNVLYDLVQGVSCSQFGMQHLPLDSLPFGVVSLVLSSLFDSGAETFHTSKNGQKFVSWLEATCPNVNADAFIDQFNKLLFPWNHVQYKVLSECDKSKLVLNVIGEYKSEFQQNDELGGVLETMVLDPIQKQLELCVCSQHKSVGTESDNEIDEDEDNGESTAAFPDAMLGVVESSKDKEDLKNIMDFNPDAAIKLEEEDMVVKLEDNEENVHFLCHICNKQFDNKDGLKTHMTKGHYLHENGNFKCPQCDKLFIEFEHLSKHELEHVFKCDNCQKMFSRKAELDNHFKLHEASTATCLHCPERFTSRADMLVHRANTHETKRFSCVHCSETFAQMRILRYHIATAHADQPQSHRCDQCSKVFFIPDNLQRHVNKVHGGSNSGGRLQRLHCDICSRSFKKQLALHYHKKRAHAVDSVPLLSCPQCDKDFGTKVALLKHKALQHRKEAVANNVCPSCGASFSTKAALKEHVRSLHPDTLVQCALCEELFTSAAAARKHEKHAHGVTKAYVCDECPAAFGDKYALERHLNMHKGVKEFSCDECGNAFHTARHLRRHKMHVHEGRPTRKTKPARVPCDRCEKTFVEKRYLVRHQQREHEGRTDYDEETCAICGQTFSGKSSLRRHHRRIHRGIKDHASRDFQCDVCAKTFVFKQSMQRHMQSAHKMLIPQFECAVCHKHFANAFNLRKHQENHSGGNTCKPRRKRSKIINFQALPQDFEINTLAAGAGDNNNPPQQFIEIQVMDVQNSVVQAYQTPENIVSTWTVQQDAATGDDTTAGFHAVPAHDNQNHQFVLEDATGLSTTEVQQLEESEDTKPQILVQNDMGGAEGWTEIAEGSIDQDAIQGEVVEVPAGVQFIQLGGKIVRLDTVMQ